MEIIDLGIRIIWARPECTPALEKRPEAGNGAFCIDPSAFRLSLAGWPKLDLELSGRRSRMTIATRVLRAARVARTDHRGRSRELEARREKSGDRSRKGERRMGKMGFCSASGIFRSSSFNAAFCLRQAALACASSLLRDLRRVVARSPDRDTLATEGLPVASHTSIASREARVGWRWWACARSRSLVPPYAFPLSQPPVRLPPSSPGGSRHRPDVLLLLLSCSAALRFLLAPREALPKWIGGRGFDQNASSPVFTLS